MVTMVKGWQKRRYEILKEFWEYERMISACTKGGRVHMELTQSGPSM